MESTLTLNRRPLDILIIEDDPDVRSNLSDILEFDGYQIEGVGTLAEALTCRRWTEFFTVILDRKLPDGMAEDFVPRIKELAPSASIIIVTGFSDLESAIAALRNGAADYILKPVDPEILRASLTRLATCRRVDNALKESQAALRRERDFAESLVQTAQAIVLVLDKDGRIVRFNPYMEELTGYNLEDVRGKDWFETFLPQRDQEHTRKVFQSTVDEGSSEEVHPLLTRDGRLRDVRWSNKTLRDAEGSVIGVLSIAQDITELKAAQERALQMERLAAIGQMVAGLAHESRNALQRSQACLEMLALQIQDRPKALDLVSRTLEAQEHLHHLYEDVRFYAAPLKISRQPCDLRAILLETWDQLAIQRAERAVTFSVAEADFDLNCEVDRSAIGQVFRNVLENSLAACTDPAEIRAGWSTCTLHGHPAVRIALSDNGPGLDAEQRTRIFEPFYTTKTHGTGLGMAIISRIVEAHDGRIEVGADLHPGTEILITLPRGAHYKG